MVRRRLALDGKQLLIRIGNLGRIQLPEVSVTGQRATRIGNHLWEYALLLVMEFDLAVKR